MGRDRRTPERFLQTFYLALKRLLIKLISPLQGYLSNKEATLCDLQSPGTR